MLPGRSFRRFTLENYITVTRQHQSEACLHVLWLRLALAEVSLASPWGRCPSGTFWPEPGGAEGIFCPGGRRHLTFSENLVPGFQLLSLLNYAPRFSNADCCSPRSRAETTHLTQDLRFDWKPGSQRNKASTLFNTSLSLFPHAISLQHEHRGCSLQFLSKTRPNPAMW